MSNIPSRGKITLEYLINSKQLGHTSLDIVAVISPRKYPNREQWKYDNLKNEGPIELEIRSPDVSK